MHDAEVMAAPPPAITMTDDAVTVASKMILEACPAFVAAVDNTRHIAMNGGDVDAGKLDVDVRKYIPPMLAVYPSTFASAAAGRQVSSRSSSGFKNDNNACFLNALVSALISLPVVLRSETAFHPQCGLRKNCGVCSFAKILRGSLAASKKSGTPTLLSKTSFGKLFSLYAAKHHLDFSGRSPADAADCLAHLLVWLRQTELSAHQALIKKRRAENTASALNYEVEDSLLEITTAVGRWFAFVTRTTEECAACGHELANQRAASWSLPIYPADGANLNSLVNRRFDDERLDRCEQCSKCACEARLFSTGLEATAPCLILRVIKSGKDRRIESPLDVIEVASPTLSARYKVSSAVCVSKHKSQLPHYYTLVSRSKGMWDLIDDDMVTSIPERKALSILGNESHILFCENLGEAQPLDQQSTPFSDVKYLAVPPELTLVESLRVLDERAQLVTGFGTEKTLYMDIKITQTGANC